MSSPQKDRYGDRFIPSRSGAVWHINFNSPPESKGASSPATSAASGASNASSQNTSNNGNGSNINNRSGMDGTSDGSKDGIAYNCLLRNELLGAGIEDLKVWQATSTKYPTCLCRLMPIVFAHTLSSRIINLMKDGSFYPKKAKTCFRYARMDLP